MSLILQKKKNSCAYIYIRMCTYLVKQLQKKESLDREREGVELILQTHRKYIFVLDIIILLIKYIFASEINSTSHKQ